MGTRRLTRVMDVGVLSLMVGLSVESWSVNPLRAKLYALAALLSAIWLIIDIES